MFGFPVQDFPRRLALRLRHLPRPGLGVVPGDRGRDARVPAADARSRRVACSSSAQDILPLLLLFAISVTGLMLTASYTWMKGYAYDFLAILHAITVIFTLLWLPFGKLFHIFQRPAQLGVEFYKDAGARGNRRAAAAAASRSRRAAWCDDLIDGRAGARVFVRDDRGSGGRPLPADLPALPAGAVRPGAGRAVASASGVMPLTAAMHDALRDDGRPLPVDDLRITERFGPHLSAMTRRAPLDAASSPSGSSRRTAASAVSSAASSSRSRTTRSSASSRGKNFRSTAACCARRASSATCRARIPTGC